MLVEFLNHAIAKPTDPPDLGPTVSTTARGERLQPAEFAQFCHLGIQPGRVMTGNVGSAESEATYDSIDPDRSCDEDLRSRCLVQHGKRGRGARVSAR